MMTTYVRKIAEGQFEYGFVTSFKNFRKQSDKYEPRGFRGTVAEAEQARAELECGPSEETIGKMVNAMRDEHFRLKGFHPYTADLDSMLRVALKKLR